MRMLLKCKLQCRIQLNSIRNCEENRKYKSTGNSR